MFILGVLNIDKNQYKNYGANMIRLLTKVALFSFAATAAFANGSITITQPTPTIEVPAPGDGGVGEHYSYMTMTNNTISDMEILAGVKVVSTAEYEVGYCFGRPASTCIFIPKNVHNTGEYYYLNDYTFFLEAAETTTPGEDNKLQITVLPESDTGSVIIDVNYTDLNNTNNTADFTQAYYVGINTSVRNPLEIELGNAYPMPASKSITIPFEKQSIKDARYIVLSSEGKIMSEGKLLASQSEQTIDLTSYPTGAYYFVPVDGEVYSGVRKFIVE